MRALVTGANGFVGRALCQELIEREFHVVAGMKVIDGDFHQCFTPITLGNKWDDTNWSACLTGVDVVFHLAARVHVMKDNSIDPLAAYLHDNSQFTSELATHAALAGVKRFIFISSIKVNGENTCVKAFTEYDQPDPQDPYAVSKLQAEKSLIAVGLDSGMEVVILRSPLVYGPGVKANFRSLLSIVDNRIPLPFKYISNIRSMIYVKNLVDALILCATHAEAKNQTFLVCDGQSVSTSQLIKSISIALGRPNMLFPFPLTVLRMSAALLGKAAVLNRLTQSLLVDSSKICKMLKWQPPYTMEQGLTATVESYKQHKKGSQ